MFGGINELIPQIFPGAHCVSCQKKDCKRKYDFEDSISNVDLRSAAKLSINV